VRGGDRRFAYRLARQLGYIDVDAAVASIGGYLGWRFAEWKAFYELEPEPEIRNDFGLARVIQVLLRSDKPLSDFMLPFGDYGSDRFVQRQVRTPEEHAKYLERRIEMWISGSNAAFREKGHV
jgi:hypothetical protein